MKYLVVASAISPLKRNLLKVTYVTTKIFQGGRGKRCGNTNILPNFQELNILLNSRSILESMGARSAVGVGKQKGFLHP